MDQDNKIGFWLKDVNYVLSENGNDIKRFYLVENKKPLILLLTNFSIDKCDERISNLFDFVTIEKLQNYKHIEIRKEGKLSNDKKFSKIKKIEICEINKPISIYHMNNRIVEKIFKKAKEKNLLVSFVTPQQDGNYLPSLKKPKHSGMKPSQKNGLLWLSTPEISTNRRSWYGFAKKNIPDMVDITKKAIIGYKIDKKDILIVNETNIDEFENIYAKNPNKKRIEIKWKEIAEKYKGFALDPYKNYFNPVNYKHYWTTFFDAVTYTIWDNSAVIDYEILYTPIYS